MMMRGRVEDDRGGKPEINYRVEGNSVIDYQIQASILMCSLETLAGLLCHLKKHYRPDSVDQNSIHCPATLCLTVRTFLILKIVCLSAK